jgi:hypothetical protein
LIDDLVTEALASIGQLVILGAGFDARAYRLPGLDEISVFEVDHPVTQQAKRQALASIVSPQASYVRLVPVDFERDGPGPALRAAGYRDDAPCLFVWEGVTNYLTPAAVDHTLGAVRGLAAVGSLLVFTYVDRAVLEGDSSLFPEARRWVKGVRRRASPGRSAWTRPRSQNSSPAGAFCSSATCPPPRPASGTSSRWAVGSKVRGCITWSWPPPTPPASDPAGSGAMVDTGLVGAPDCMAAMRWRGGARCPGANWLITTRRRS